MEFDIPAQYDRDLRGAALDVKRHKDSTRKWRLGDAPLAGVRWNPLVDGPPRGHDGQQKVRPASEDRAHPSHKLRHNMVKLTRGNYELAPARVKSQMGIHEELEASRRGWEGDAAAMSPGAAAAGLVNDPFLYSFDQTVTPGAPLTLDVFVKAPTARDTERLVEKEYEVVDENGRGLRGKEAKRNLRNGGGSGHWGEKEVEDGFELV
jgi:hypothetical protein